jgi:hypothetical protein
MIKSLGFLPLLLFISHSRFLLDGVFFGGFLRLNSRFSLVNLNIARVFSWLGEIDDRWSGGLGARCRILAGQCWSPSAHDKIWLGFPYKLFKLVGFCPIYKPVHA